MSDKKHIVVGLSGGVDSAVTALLLKEAGHRVTGIFMKNWEAEDGDEYCTAEQDLADAAAVCQRLDIPLQTVNFAQQYWDKVFTYFLDEYRLGRTPNPDVLCNTEIKFKAFLEHAKAIGADCIATGHYADSAFINNQFVLLKASDTQKDQTYFLHGLNQSQLSQAIFPLGKFNKRDVRLRAEQAGLVNHNKKDSTGICFIGERRFKTFLQEYLLARPGVIENQNGIAIGEHDGLMFYTLGQRQGLKIGGVKGSSEAPWYVYDKDISRNVLKVVQGSEDPLLFTSEIYCQNLHFIAGTAPAFPFIGKAKIRYRQTDQDCVIEALNPGYKITFTTPQRAATPGQYLVIYSGNHCLGGGIIDSKLPNT